MMDYDDLVGRLRHYTKTEPYYKHTFTQSADAIETLRGERDEAQEWRWSLGEQLQKEIILMNTLIRERDDAHARADAAERKVEKLREALNFYARHSTYRTCTIYMSGKREKTDAERDCGEIARAALAETENGDE